MEEDRINQESADGARTEEPGEDEMTIEEIFTALDGIIDEMESGSGSLEDTFARYEQGIRLVKRCSGKIDRIEKQVLVLSGEKGGADEHEF